MRSVIGQTTRSLDERVREHIGYIRNLHLNQPTREQTAMFTAFFPTLIGFVGIAASKPQIWLLLYINLSFFKCYEGLELIKAFKR